MNPTEDIDIDDVSIHASRFREAMRDTLGKITMKTAVSIHASRFREAMR